MQTERVIWKRENKLIRKANSYAKIRKNKFIGPSKYFYSKLIRYHQKKSLKNLLSDNLFYEYIYATLVSWGMHRMGPKGAHMTEFNTFKKSIWSCRKELLVLDGLVLE